MSQQLINRSSDLTKLQNEGYELEIRSGHLVVHNVPYVTSNREVMRGALVSELSLSGDITVLPNTHVAMFTGEYPCDKHGRPLEKIYHQAQNKDLGDGLIVRHSFSSKPRGGYRDYYHKMSTYADMISSHAQSIDGDATAKTFNVIEAGQDDPVFNYIDTATSRAGISAVTKKLELDRIGVVGLGGTGSYVLDLVAKTPVREIHLFDKDQFLQHNAFRAPGAASIDDLKAKLSKAEYMKNQYAPLRRGIVTHEVYIDETNIDLLREMNFVFLCMDGGSAKGDIIRKLEEFGVPFVDVGMGIELVDDRLLGILRVTASTPGQRDHVWNKQRIPISAGNIDDVYSTNIQVADLNALNAALAVIKWKKLCGFYADLEREHFSTYTIDGNIITNEDPA